MKSLNLKMVCWELEPKSFWYREMRKEGEEPVLAVSVRNCKKHIM